MSGELIGYAALKRKLAALEPGKGLGREIMGDLQAMALAEQKRALYEMVTRRTGQSGANVVRGTLTDSSAETVARSTAALIESGTRPHDIRPRFKKALFFSASGAGTRLTGSVQSRYRKGGAGLVPIGPNVGTFAMHVHHRGTKPRPFMIEGAKRAIEKAGLADRIVARWNHA